MTLTEAAYWTRRLGVVLGGGLVVLILVVVIILNINKEEVLPKFLKADYACTATAEEFKAQALQIPTLELAEGSEKIYTIETPTGRLEALPGVAYVYQYDNQVPSLNSQNDAKKLATALGFDPEKVLRRGGIAYDWPEDNFGRTLTVDARNLNFTLKTNFTRTGALPTEKKLPTVEQAKNIAKSFLSSQGYLLDDYKDDQLSVTLIDVKSNGSYALAPSIADAELLRVDFFREIPFISVRSDYEGAQEIKSTLEKEYLNYPPTTESIVTDTGRVDVYNFETNIFASDPQKGNISVYVGTEDNRKNNTEYPNIYAIDYVGWIINPEPCGTYDLISATEATTIIENGKASLVYLNEVGGDYVVPYTSKKVLKFSVNEVVLSYLDTLDEQTYLQPIYLVIGEATLESGIRGQFYYYIPAINYNVIQDRKEISPATTGQSTSDTTNTQ